jgi:hypothetical protein
MAATTPAQSVILVLATARRQVLAQLRLAPGVVAAEADGCIWLRAERPAPALAARLAALPCTARYHCGGADALTVPGSRVATAVLPELTWQPLSDFLRPTVEATQAQAPVPTPAALTLVPSDLYVESAAVAVPYADWRAYVGRAPLRRLSHLRFAVSAAAEVLVVGRPQPPVRGRHYYAHGALLLPAGFALSPAVAGSWAAPLLGLAAGELALFREDGSWERLCDEELQPVSRSAVRRSAPAADARQMGSRDA